MRIVPLVLTTAALLAASQTLSAQDARPRGPVRGGGGAVFVVALPTGDFADNIKAGAGFAMSGHYNVTRDGVLRLRADGGFVQYGHESREVCFSNTVGCRVRLDLTTANQIVYAGGGPELMLPTRYVQPYLNAGIGLSYFMTGSYVSGDDEEGDNFASTTNQHDAVLAYTGGGGFYIPLSVRRSVVALDLSARYHRNGTVEYLREGDIRDNPDGTIDFDPIRGQANFVTLQLGVSVGFRSTR